MPMYFFHLRDQETIHDVDGTHLADAGAARAHADAVAQELKFKNDRFLDEGWSRWTMLVQDDDGLELFSFPMAEVKTPMADGKKDGGK